MQIDLRDRVVWVTGASKGIGTACAESFARSGALVACSYRSGREAAEDLVSKLQNQGFRAICLHLDISSEDSVRDAFAKICRDLGEVQILINNAGIIEDDLFMLLDDARWTSVLDTNLLGAVRCIRACVRAMMMRRWGRIINMSSVAGQSGGRGQANYAASKAALEGMTRSLAIEFGSKGITVNCLAPGVIETDMSKGVRQLAGEEILGRQAIKRFGRVEEIAAWACMLASVHGEFVTGQTIRIDGGLR